MPTILAQNMKIEKIMLSPNRTNFSFLFFFSFFLLHDYLTAPKISTATVSDTLYISCNCVNSFFAEHSANAFDMVTCTFSRFEYDPNKSIYFCQIGIVFLTFFSRCL